MLGNIKGEIMRAQTAIMAGLLALVAPIVLWAGGAVVDTTIYSPALDTDRDVRIYLPEGYDPDDSRRYPVVYFLHGASVTYDLSWQLMVLEVAV